MIKTDTLTIEQLRADNERLSQRLAEANGRLMELKERLSMIGTSAKVGIWEYDFRTDVLWVSDELAAMYGYTPAELTWEKFVDSLHPDDVVPDLERPTPSFPFGRVNEFFFRFRDAHGEFRTVRSRSTTYGVGDTPHRKMGAHIDMSTDALLKLNSELAEANDRISQFSSVASHDLRSPLRSISTMVYLTLNDRESALSPKAVERLETATDRIGQMDRLVSDLLHYSTADLAEVKPTATDVNQVLRSVADLISGHGPTVTVDSSVGTVMVTASPLTVCVRNLADNACKHHDRPDGRVSLAARLDDDWLEIIVSDDGPGIPEYLQTRIFEPFYSSNQQKGSGLGLAHVNRVIEQYDGHLELSSTEGEGTTFTLRWPVCRASDSQESRRSAGKT